ncbi:hypothetical protein D3C73_1333930 [compost metagenome]
MQRNKQRALAVESLSDNDEIVGIKYFAGAHNGVKCTETGVIKHDVGRIDASGNQIFTHRHRFVVVLLGIVAAEQQIIHLTAVIRV